jgi:ribosomal protein S18
MSDQINPTSEEQEEIEEITTPRVPQPAAAFDADDDFDGDDNLDVDDDDDLGDDDLDDNVVEGPAEYVQREKSGRGRRIGGDVRPEDVDYKNIPLLSRFLDRRGRILSRRKTRVSAASSRLSSAPAIWRSCHTRQIKPESCAASAGKVTYGEAKNARRGTAARTHA